MVVSVRFDAETGEYESSIDDLIKAIKDWESQTGVSALNVTEKFEDAIRAVVELGRRGDESSDTIVRALQGLGLSADDAKEALAAVEREAKGLGDGLPASATKAEDALRRVSDGADDAGKKTTGISDGAAKAGEGIRGLGDIARDVLQGDLTSALQSAGSELSALGPAATVAGTAITVIITAALASAQEAQEKLNGARERAIELATALYQNGGTLPLTDHVEELIQKLGSERLAQGPVENIANNFLDLGTNLDTARRAAREAEVPFSRIIGALTGADIGDTKRALEGVSDALERVDKEVVDGDFNWQKWSERRQSLVGVKDELESVLEQSRLAAELYNSTGFMNTEKLEKLGEAWRNTATDAGDYFTRTEEGAAGFDGEAYLRDAEATIAAADEMKRRLVGLPPEIRAEAERVFSEQGAVAANEYTKAYETASAADKSRYIAAANANGDAAGKAQAEALKRSFGSPILDATVRINVDSSRYDQWKPNERNVYMNVIPRTINQAI